MPFNKTENVAQFGGADWSNFIKKISNTTPQIARRIAMCDPEITFFFFCREYMVLEGKGTFNPGDSVFFSGNPWMGSAPQCDVYEKDFFTIGYVGVNSNNFGNAGCYILPDERQFFDIASIFAANINLDPVTQKPILYFNPQVDAVLNGPVNYVKQLQELGITVLLTVLGNHQNAGWSCFTNEADAMDFAQQLAACVNQYGLDGIDIDDEYSTCTANNSSLIIITDAMRQLMPNKIISKALFQDLQYFQAQWKGMKLSDTLTYGWEMSYGGADGLGRLEPYVKTGMQKNQLSVGVWQNSDAPENVKKLTQCMMDNNFGGMMVFDVTKQSQNFLSNISTIFYKEDTTTKPDCLQ
jgi:hypothetical protein